MPTGPTDLTLKRLDEMVAALEMPESLWVLPPADVELLHWVLERMPQGPAMRWWVPRPRWFWRWAPVWAVRRWMEWRARRSDTFMRGPIYYSSNIETAE